MMRGAYTKTEHFEVIDTLGVPHLYKITDKLVEFVANKHSWTLNEAAIKDGEEQGITCGVIGCQLSFEEHEQVLLIACKAPLKINGEVNPELHQYLLDNKKECEDNGYVGFSFLDKR